MHFAIANNKGGAGKTTVTGCLAEALAARGRRVLVVDVDPQANLTRRMGYSEQDLTHMLTAAEVIKADQLGCGAEAFVSCRWDAAGLAEHIDLLPSRYDLENRITESGLLGSHLRLVRALSGVTDDYDTVLLDCPPALGHLTQLALAAADSVIIPLRPEWDYIAGATRVRDFLAAQAHNLARPGLSVAGVIVNEQDRRRGLHGWHLESIVNLFGDLVWSPVIPARTQLAEAIDAAQPLRARGFVASDLVETFDALAARLEDVNALAGA